MNVENILTKRNPQSRLPIGLSPKERGRAKLVDMLCWIYKWHITATPLAREFLGTTETNFLQQLEKKGLVKSFAAPTLICGRGYMLTPDGVNAAASALGNELRYSCHPSSVSHSLLKHNLATQRACMSAHKAGYGVTPGRFLSAGTDRKIPDAIIGGNGVLQAVEVELTGKYNEELEQSLIVQLNSLASGDWQKVMYVSNSQTLLNRYKKQLNFPFPDWWQSVQNDNSKRWMRGQSREVSDNEKSCFSWNLAPALLKGFEMI